MEVKLMEISLSNSWLFYLQEDCFKSGMGLRMGTASGNITTKRAKEF